LLSTPSKQFSTWSGLRSGLVSSQSKGPAPSVSPGSVQLPLALVSWPAGHQPSPSSSAPPLQNMSGASAAPLQSLSMPSVQFSVASGLTAPSVSSQSKGPRPPVSPGSSQSPSALLSMPALHQPSRSVSWTSALEKTGGSRFWVRLYSGMSKTRTWSLSLRRMVSVRGPAPPSGVSRSWGPRGKVWGRMLRARG